MAEEHERVETPGPEPRFWLHVRHGTDTDSLEPADVVQLADRSAIASAAGIDSQMSTERAIGVPCHLRGVELRAGEGEREKCISAMFFADVSISLMPGPLEDTSTRYFIIVIPPAPGDALSGSTQDIQQKCWLLHCESSLSYCALAETFSRAGALRRDFNEVIVPVDDDHHHLGKGAYASVKRMFWKPDNDVVAVKHMNADTCHEAIGREVATLIDVLPHENIIKFLGIFRQAGTDNAQISIVFTLAPNGDLLSRVMNHGVMPEATARSFFGGMLQGLKQIHSRGIVHRDIKAENVLIDAKLEAVIADFGLATWLDNDAQMGRRCGSLGYVAPEVCLGDPYGCKVDMFGAGVVLYFMLSMELPFSSLLKDVAATIMRSTVKCKLHLHRYPFGMLSKAARALLRVLICRSIEDRLSAEDALKHAWITAGHLNAGHEPGAELEK